MALSGCVASIPVSTELGSGSRSVYNCGSDGRLTVRRLGGSVDVVSPRGIETRLPASPPGQSARYGTPPYALVIDRGEALWFVTGKRPIACKR